MEAPDIVVKRKSRFSWARWISKKAPEDAILFASDVEPPSSVDKRPMPKKPKTLEGSWKHNVPTKVKGSVLPDAPNGKPATEARRGPRELLPFGEQRIAIAVDRSASTWGNILAEENAFIHAVCSLLSPRNENPVQVLPWNHTAARVISMPKQTTSLSQVDATGGTDPRVLYSTRPYLDALKGSRLWFLLTDGEISDDVVQDFALKTATNQMHGTACIIVVFGSAKGTRPASCDISVGVAVYAVAPDCLFLFFDTSSGTLYNVQCKGCFKSLLPSPDAQRMLHADTQWSDLPTISIEDLQRLEIPAPVRVTRDEMALQGQLRVNLEQLYSGHVPQEDLSEIIRNDDNLKSIVMAETTRGRGEKLQGWLRNQYKEQPTLSKERPDLGGKAQRAVTDLLHYLQHDGSDEKITNLRRELRIAHQANRENFESILNSYHDEKGEVDDHNQRVRWASSLSAEIQGSSTSAHGGPRYNSQSMSSMPNKSSTRYKSSMPSKSSVPSTPSPPLYSPDDCDANMPPHFPSLGPVPVALGGGPSASARHPAPSLPLASAAPAPAEPARGRNKQTTNELFFPGFQGSADPQRPGFTGKCMLCDSDSILTLLLKTPPKISTPNFPTVGSQTALAFPLAIGRFAELDIVSSFLCCDSCALYLVRSAVSPYRETIVDALPLVPFADNKVAWLGVVAAALRGRIRSDDLPSVFVAILDRVMSKIAQNLNDGGGKALLHSAAQWLSNDIWELIQVPRSFGSTFAPSIASGSSSTTFTSLLSDRTMFQPENSPNREPFSLRYPLPGFAVVIRLFRDRGTPRSQLELLTFHRLLYHMTEAHFRNLVASGEEAANDLLTQILTEIDLDLTIRPVRTHPIRAVSSISTQAMVAHPAGLLDETSLAIFQDLDEFDAVEKQVGPATAVFLHHLLKIAPKHGSPVDVFNTIKALPSMDRVMNTPSTVTEDLVAEFTTLHL